MVVAKPARVSVRMAESVGYPGDGERPLALLCARRVLNDRGRRLPGA